MKNSGICPKCGSGDILKVLSYTNRFGGGDVILTDNTLPVWLCGVEVPRYVCCACGYSEEWIDPKNLLKLKKQYGRP